MSKRLGFERTDQPVKVAHLIQFLILSPQSEDIDAKSSSTAWNRARSID